MRLSIQYVALDCVCVCVFLYMYIQCVRSLCHVYSTGYFTSSYGTEFTAIRKVCQMLVDRQTAIEQAVNQQLRRISTCLDQLIILAPVSQAIPPPSLTPCVAEQPPPTPCVPDPVTSTPTHTDSAVPFILASSAHLENSVQTQSSATLPQTMQPQPLTRSNTEKPTSCLLTESVISTVRLNSCSRDNFSVNLVRELFSEEERITCNVRPLDAASFARAWINTLGLFSKTHTLTKKASNCNNS